MRILIISQEPPFDPARVATGNAIRTLQLKDCLEAGGHQCRQLWLESAGHGADGFANADELQGLLRRERADVVLVSYWELLELLPYELDLPVILDFVAPRPLEALFETPGELSRQLRSLRLALARVDLLLVGNAEQESLLAYWLLEAGMDLRAGSRTLVVPLAGAPVARPETAGQPEQTGFTLVSGGVDWPWRQSQRYMDAVQQAVQEHAGRLHLVQFGGRYRLKETPAGEAPDDDSSRWPLAAYRDYSAFLAGTAHIGLELGESNIERRFSQSFRSLDFLRHGLPLICSEHLPLAALVRDYQAGWLVAAPEQLPELFGQLLRQPGEWRERSANATRLVCEALNPEHAGQPLLDWLEAPNKAPRLPGYGLPERTPAVLGVPPFRQRLGRQYRLARRVALARWFGRAPGDGSSHILMLSRGDLFPSDHGAAVKIVETARGLSRHGQDVLLLTDARDHYFRFRDGAQQTLPLPAWLRLLSRPLALTKLDHYTRDLPESNAFLYLPLTDGSFFWRSLWVAGRHGVQVLQAEFPAYAQPLLDVGAILDKPVVMVEHNVEYERLRDQLPELSDEQYRRFRAIEINLANRCDAVVCVSDNDRRRLAADGVHPGLLSTIPHGIDLEGFDRAGAEPLRARLGIAADTPLLAYHGTFSYPPNRKALQVLADEILPRLHRRGLAAQVLAIGQQPPGGLGPDIHCMGSVENVAPFLKAADLAVVPLLDGGGTRMKIIDYFAAGLPVVSTSKGIEGIPVSDGVEALIRDDWDAMADAIVDILRTGERAAQLRANGRKLAESLDWTTMAGRYQDVYRQISR